MPDTDGGTRTPVADHLAEVHHLVDGGLRAIRQQAEQPAVTSCLDAELTVREVQGELERQVASLEQRLTALGRSPTADSQLPTGGPPPNAPRTVEAIGGDHEYLQRLSLAYQRLQATCQAHGDQESTRLAEQGCASTGRLLRDRLGRLTPRVAAIDHATPGPFPPGVVR